VEASQIRTFGWPICVVLNKDPWRPHPTSEGVEAEIAISPKSETLDNRTSYDFWSLRQTGDLFLLQSLFEDDRTEAAIFLDTRIVRVTELLMFLSRLYSRLEVPDSEQVLVNVTHGGLKGRELKTANPNRMMFERRASSEDSVTGSVTCTVAELESKLVEQVKALLEPLFVLFDFFELGDPVWAEIVNKFVDGKTS
jgi:hypothetical protein